MKSLIRPVFSVIVASTMIVSCGLLAEPGKCSPCQAAKSARDAIQQSIKEAAAAALAAGGPFLREKELDVDNDPAKCKPCQRTTRDEIASEVDNDPAKCKPCQRTTRDEIASEVDNDPAKCKPCQRTTRDVIVSDLLSDRTLTIAACCEFCAQPGSLGCQGENSARCNTCQQGLLKISIAEAAAAALVLAQAIAARENELDNIPADALRAPREELADPCNPCGNPVVCNTNTCQINEQLNALRCCCASVAYRLESQGKEARGCCKKLRHKIDDVEALVETVIDQSTDCCSLTESLLVSVIDQIAINASVSESLSVSIIDQSAACCSTSESLLLSIIDLILLLID